MNTEDLRRFTADLQEHASVSAELHIDPNPEGLHVLHINGVDFYFGADGSGYDGWGKRPERHAQA